MDINDIAREIHTWVEDNGWHNKTPLECLALIASEVGEAVNECRGVEPTDKFAEEVIDILIRTLDLAYDHGIDVGVEIARKMEINRQRGTRGRLK
jgi:NTP pyrophosphatase (non-canonical NTP hydrolase)